MINIIVIRFYAHIYILKHVVRIRVRIINIFLRHVPIYILL